MSFETLNVRILYCSLETMWKDLIEYKLHLVRVKKVKWE
jgi:hypothetical protein